jgi:hypothetical protein
MADRFEHLPNLPIASFMNDDREERFHATLVRPDKLEALHFGRRRAASIDDDPAREPLHFVVVRYTENADFVLAPDAMAWMRQHRCQVAVARQDQQAFRLVVESPDWIDVVADPVAREKVDDGRTMLRIDAARDVAAGLVQEKVTATCGRLDSSPIDPDVVRLRIRFRSELQNRRVIDSDAALRNELLRGAA